jgi:hypothetical protein
MTMQASSSFVPCRIEAFGLQGGVVVIFCLFFENGRYKRRLDETMASSVAMIIGCPKAHTLGQTLQNGPPNFYDSGIMNQDYPWMQSSNPRIAT